MTRSLSTSAFAALTVAACIRPVPLTEERALEQMTSSFDELFKTPEDPDSSRDVAVLNPRFGFPVIVEAGAAFDVDVLERGGPSTLRAALVAPGVEVDCDGIGAGGGGVHVLTLRVADRTREESGITRARYSAAPSEPTPAGGFDLLVCADADAPMRFPRAVWTTADDPAARPSLRIAHLSDLHVRRAGARPGRAEEIATNLRQVIADVNGLRPDAVIVTGDIADHGDDPGLLTVARDMLLAVDAPVFAVMGNHDHGFSAEAFFAEEYPRGWIEFSRAFHPHSLFRATLGGWDLVGLDSGPSLLVPLVLTRGAAEETVDRVGRWVEDARARGHGVIVFSHAPTRARAIKVGEPEHPGFAGSMVDGALELEDIYLRAAARGQRVVHLAGHTHWSALFESEMGADDLRFVMRPNAAVDDCEVYLAPAALVVTQAATHTTFPFRPDAAGHGYAVLELGPDDARVTFRRFGEGDLRCRPSSP